MKMVHCFHKIVCVLGLLMAMHSNAQSVDQWTAWGDAAFSKGEYYGASRYYDGALIADPGRMALQWKQAEACRMSNQYDKAHMLYDKVYRKDQGRTYTCLLYTSPSPRDRTRSRMPSSA